jgi:hypothetical protein
MTNKSIVNVLCHACGANNVVGLSQESPEVEYILSREQLENKHNAVIDAIKASTLPDDVKKRTVEHYGGGGTIIDPTLADSMLAELTTTYAPKEPETK